MALDQELPAPTEQQLYAESLRVKYAPFEALMAQSSDPLLAFERHPKTGEIVFAYANPKARRELALLLNVDEARMLSEIGVPLNSGLVAEPVSATFRRDCEAVFAAGGELRNQITLDNGQQIFTLEYKVYEGERDEAGVVQTVGSSLRDISERLLMQQQIEHLNRNIKMMVGTFAHDVGNLLAAILTNQYLLTRMIEGTVDDTHGKAEMIAKLKRIHANANAINGMAQTFLAREAIDNGTFPPCTPTELAVHEVIADLVNDHQETNNKGHAFEVDLQLPDSVVVDEMYLKHIMGNLVSNAIKYSPAGSTVGLSGRVVEGKLVFSVTDQGEGISAENMLKLFKAFERFSEDKHAKGTGLGLHIAATMALMHGGTIKVDTEAGKGSTFSLELPHVAVAEAVDP